MDWPYKIIATPTLTPKKFHKLQKMVQMNADISETIKASNVGLNQI